MPDGTVLPPCAAPRAKRDLKMFVLFITAFAARNAGRAGITPVPTSGGGKRGKPPSWWRQRKAAADALTRLAEAAMPAAGKAQEYAAAVPGPRTPR